MSYHAQPRMMEGSARESIKGERSSAPGGRRRFSSGRIDLDVGGTVFATSAMTLTSCSTYFASLFSEEWQTERGGNEEGDGVSYVFVDQDPAPFAVLLSFMRRGYVQASDLNRDVLMQADFFGVEKLLAAVKRAAYLNANPNLAFGSDDELCRAFDEEFGGVSAAVSNGALPSLVHDRFERKEYGFIKVMKNAQLEGRRDLVVIIDAPSCPTDELEMEGDRNQGRRYATFLDALNFLHRRGFTTMEEEFQEDCLIDDSVERRFTFSRVAKDDKPRSHLADMIIYAPSHEERYNGPKEFACAVETRFPHRQDACVCVYADTGDIPSVHSMSGNLISQVPVCSSIVTFDTNVCRAMDWLQRESYRQEEKALGDVFAKIWDDQLVKNDVGAFTSEEKCVRLKLFSRKCPRRKDDHVRARVVSIQQQHVRVIPPA